MEEKLHKKILLVSITVIILSILVIIIANQVESLIETTPLAYTLIEYAFLAVLASFAIKFKDKVWLTRIAKYSFYLLILAFIPFIIYAIYDNYSFLFNLITAFVIVISILTLIHLFVYKDATSLNPIIVFMTLMVIGIFWKRQHWPLAGAMLVISSFALGAGGFIYGIRCLFIAEKDNYFRNVTSLGSFALSLAFVGQMFKMQHWPGAAILMYTGFAGLILGTLNMLLTIPSSGFINWTPFKKKVFRRILIPWAFILFLYISRFMVPELNALVFSPDSGKVQKRVSTYGFGMKDYDIEVKTGNEVQ